MDTQFRKGLLEAYILSLLRAGPTYGYQLCLLVAQKMEISESTLYPILRRLENQNYLATFQEEHGGRLRKYYLLTPLGFSKHQQNVESCRKMASLLAEIIGG